MTTQIMLDLETLGKTVGSVIVGIGAVKFGGGLILDSFYARVDAVSCEAIGLSMDAETVVWWMTRDDLARQELTSPGREPIKAALARFSAWVGDPEACMWGNGPSFDCAILHAAYMAAGLPCPWRYQNERCYRTAKTFLPEQAWVRSGTHHNALDDATSQATYLMAAMSVRSESAPISKPFVRPLTDLSAPPQPLHVSGEPLEGQ